jgi:hypothetical protein
MSTTASDERRREADVLGCFGPREDGHVCDEPCNIGHGVHDVHERERTRETESGDPGPVPRPENAPARRSGPASGIPDVVRVSSRSAPATFYEVRREGERLTCTCRGFAFRKTCWHVRAVEVVFRADKAERVRKGVKGESDEAS